jgi:hypothetical protein
VLERDEFRWFWSACEEEGFPYGPLLQLIALTDQREREIAKRTRDDLGPDNNELKLPVADIKNKRSHIVPTSSLARQIIEKLPRIPGTTLLFPNTENNPASSFGNVKIRIDRLMERCRLKETNDPQGTIKPWQFRDLRRTAATHMARLGHDPDVVDMIMNHTSPRSGHRSRSAVAHVYNRYDYFKERTAALEDWGELVRSWVEPSCQIASSPATRVLASGPALLVDFVSDMHIDRHRDSASLDWASLKSPGARILVDAGDDADSPIRTEQLLLEAKTALRGRDCGGRQSLSLRIKHHCRCRHRAVS